MTDGSATSSSDQATERPVSVAQECPGRATVYLSPDAIKRIAERGEFVGPVDVEGTTVRVTTAHEDVGEAEVTLNDD